MSSHAFTRRSLAALGAAAFLAITAVSARAETPLAEVHIGYQKNGPILLARQQGLIEKKLADRGIKVTWVEFTSGPPLLEALGAGAVDFGPTGDIPPVFAQAAGRDLLYVGATPPSGGGSAILVKQDSPVKSLEDLKGKKIGYKYGSSANNFIVQALKKAGLSVSDIQRSDLSPADGAAAFSSGAIDAWVIWDPFYAIAQKKPDVRVLADGKGIADFPSYYLANGTFTRAHPKIVQDILSAVGEATQWAASHKPEAAKAFADVTGVGYEFQLATVNRTNFGLLPVTDDIIKIQQTTADTFFDLKLVPKHVNVRDIVWTPPAS